MEDLFYELILVALGNRKTLSRNPSDQEWRWFFLSCQKQAIVAFVFPSLDKLIKAGQKVPVGLVYEWLAQCEQVKAENELMNHEAARLTKIFEDNGHRTAILKGQANARLYPQPWSRQPGDIDIWVSGGKEKVLGLLRKLGLLKGEIAKYMVDGDLTLTSYHIHLPKNENGVDVEVHFRPSSGNVNPITNRRLQAFLEEEINKENELTPEGFRVPSLKFALVMQLAHIQRHLVSEGVGMRQIIDYYYLLKSNMRSSSARLLPKGRKNFTNDTNIRNILNYCGLKHIAEAMMWVLHEKLGLEDEYLIAPMDERRGKMLLQQIMEGGNFGHYHLYKQHGLRQRILAKNKHRIQMFRFDFSEAFWIELKYFTYILKTIPARIKRRKWSLE